MNNDFNGLFSNLDTIDPPTGLYEKIVARIARRIKIMARLRFSIFGILGILSTASLFPAYQYFSNSFYQSGFYDYFSLIFSDSKNVFASIKTFGLLLLESAPVVEIVLLLTAIFVILWSAKIMAKNMTAAKFSALSA